MLENAEIVGFIRNSFRSVWSLELLLLLKSEPERSWSEGELVDQLRRGTGRSAMPLRPGISPAWPTQPSGSTRGSRTQSGG
jgi:hypothetical protein